MHLVGEKSLDFCLVEESWMFSVHDPLMGAFLSAQVQQETIPGRCAWVCT